MKKDRARERGAGDEACVCAVKGYSPAHGGARCQGGSSLPRTRSLLISSSQPLLQLVALQLWSTACLEQELCCSGGGGRGRLPVGGWPGTMLLLPVSQTAPRTPSPSSFILPSTSCWHGGVSRVYSQCFCSALYFLVWIANRCSAFEYNRERRHHEHAAVTRVFLHFQQTKPFQIAQGDYRRYMERSGTNRIAD